ncbi:MAG: hypothetical protein IRF16MM_01740 [Candidatus Midichloria mitochondrii]
MHLPGDYFTGKLVDLSTFPDFSSTRLIGKLGEPVLPPAIKKAIHIIPLMNSSWEILAVE